MNSRQIRLLELADGATGGWFYPNPEQGKSVSALSRKKMIKVVKVNTGGVRIQLTELGRTALKDARSHASPVLGDLPMARLTSAQDCRVGHTVRLIGTKMPMAVVETGVCFDHIPFADRMKAKPDFVECCWYDMHASRNVFRFHFSMLEGVR